MQHQNTFSGNKKLLGVVPAACLLVITLGSVSSYAGPEDITLPLVILAVLITFSLIVISLRGES